MNDSRAAYVKWREDRGILIGDDTILASELWDAAWQAAQATPPAAEVPTIPAAKVWNQTEGRDGKQYTDGWNACRAAILAAQEVGNE